MRVYFGVCGIGLGHAGRTIPIAKKLQEGGVDVVFSTYRDGIDFVANEGLPLVRAPPIGFVIRPDGSVDFRQTAVNPGPFFSLFTFLRQLHAELRFLKSFKPNLVVSDSRVSSIIAAKLLGIPKITMLNQYQVIVPAYKRFLRLARIADVSILAIIGKVWVMGEYVLIPDFPEPYTLSLGNLRIPSGQRKKVKLIGPILPKRPEELPSQEELREKLGYHWNDSLIFAAISGPVRQKAYISGILRRFFEKFPDHYKIILSLGYPNAASILVKKGSLSIYNWIPNRFEFLKACDLVVARPGHGTLSQSICFGKPLLLIPTPNHTEQLNNARRASELGVAKVIKQEDLSYDTLFLNVREILETGRFKNRAKQIQKAVLNYNALATTVKLITEIVQMN